VDTRIEPTCASANEFLGELIAPSL
jgi:hypothetical protein